MDALQNAKRLDQDFISGLVMEHASGISVLASPDAYSAQPPSESRTVGKLLEVFRNQYPYVVIDAGRELGDGAEAAVSDGEHDLPGDPARDPVAAEHPALYHLRASEWGISISSWW